MCSNLSKKPAHVSAELLNQQYLREKQNETNNSASQEVSTFCCRPASICPNASAEVNDNLTDHVTDKKIFIALTYLDSIAILRQLREFLLRQASIIFNSFNFGLCLSFSVYVPGERLK